MRATSVDIENELREVQGEADRLSLVLRRLGSQSLQPESQEAWEAAHVCASATEKVYTGCERVMARLASEVDGAPVTHAEGWHSALLRRMANPFPGVREPVLSAECQHALDRLRAFRHRARNTYGANLDLDIVLERAEEAVVAFGGFRDEVRAFPARHFASGGSDPT
jgi:hypothetical protein